MRIDTMYPVVLTDDPKASAQFWAEQFGFQQTFESDWYVQLFNPSQPACQLALLLQSHDSVPAFLRQAAQTTYLGIEVTHATKEWERLSAAGFEILQPLQDEAWGQRHFMLAAPDGVVLDIIQVIPASGEYVDYYTSGQFAIKNDQFA